jgi:hypothetical protein
MKSKIIILFLSISFILSNAEASIDIEDMKDLFRNYRELNFEKASKEVEKFKGIYSLTHTSSTSYDSCYSEPRSFACCPFDLLIDLAPNLEQDIIYINLNKIEIDEDIYLNKGIKFIWKFKLNKFGEKAIKVESADTASRIIYDSKWATIGNWGSSEFYDKASLRLLLEDKKLQFTFARDHKETTCWYETN